VDDFYRDPDGIRAAALAGDFSRKEWRPRICFWEECFEHGQDVASVMSRIQTIIGKQLHYDIAMQGFFRLFSLESYLRVCRQDIIVHMDDYDWSGIVCLSPSYRGTIPLYRHKESGLTHLAGNHQWIPPFSTDSAELSRWEIIDELDVTYNQLILFAPRQFHFIGHGCGDRRETARLTQQFQFDEVRPDRAPKVTASNW